VHDLTPMPRPARPFPAIPSVERILSSQAGQRLSSRFARGAVVDAVRAVLADVRERMKAGAAFEDGALEIDALATRAESTLRAGATRRARRVVNATGVILHTNLGRARLAASAVEAAATAAAHAVALEYDLDAGGRGERDRLVEDHLIALTGAEAVTVVNNNAAALLLVLNSLAEGREVIVSRGELIEIGGSFRIPDVMAKSGAILREVGTTNRTHVSDYEDAIQDSTALLLKVHTSNYRIVGFTACVGLAELRDVAARHGGLAVVEDLGSGALIDLSRFGLPHEPVVRERLAAGADIVTFSGDKLLGGPQCGVIVGRGGLIGRVARNPLKRALRCDKMTLAALEETLRLYRFDPAPEASLPTLWALTRPIEDLERVGREAAARIADVLGAGFDVGVEKSQAQTGSGSQPGVAIESRAIAVTSAVCAPDAIAARFRAADPPIIGRIERDRFLLDLRTIADPADLVPRFAAGSAYA
jgi:L-seryl-tRNA(Ser) seleniumtransferase